MLLHLDFRECRISEVAVAIPLVNLLTHLSDPQLLLLVGRGQDRHAGKRMHLGREGRLARSVASVGRNERDSALAQRSVHRHSVENRRSIHARGSCRWREIEHKISKYFLLVEGQI